MTSPLEINAARTVQTTTEKHVHQKRDHHQPPEFPDSLSKSEKRPFEDFSPSKPSLPELRVLKAVMEARDASQRTLSLTADALDLSQDELKALLVEKAEKLKEVCERTQSMGIWDTLRKIGSAILGAVTAFLGITIFATGGSTLLGGALVVSGVLSLANLAFTDSGVWDWMAEKVAGDNEDKKKKISALLPCVIGLVACGLGLASLGAFGAVWTLPTMPRALAMVQMAANFLTISGTVGGQVSHAKVSMSQAALHDLQTKMSQNHHQVDRLSDNVEQIMEQEAELTRSARSLLNLTIQTKQALLV